MGSLPDAADRLPRADARLAPWAAIDTSPARLSWRGLIP
jgi:hypothetical protein